MDDKVKPGLVLVAQVSGAIGLQGEFKLLSFMDDPANVLNYKPLLNAAGLPALTLTKARQHKQGLVVRAEGVLDRNAVDRLMGLKLYIDRAHLPVPADDEYYITDLIGLPARNAAGQTVGKIIAVENFGAGDLLDIKPLEGPSFYLAFTLENVPEVRLSEGHIVVDLSGL